MLTNSKTEPILIVEDLEDDVLLLQMALKRNEVQGQVCIVSNGQEAVDYLRGLPPYDDRNKYPFPYIIYSDLKMPLMNGFELLTWIKSHTDCSVIPFIILTASAQESDVKRAFELGANAYLVKPSTLKELTEMIGKSLGFWEISQKPRPPEKCS
ncbi:response regulator [Pedosphaera parvula]|uniref:Response regulator receiver protein n=1 Tax=Pedosphaera parvula (strain Ellin514) TaxID=320771 RepID=B9XKQ5_PEDPL|nr:response regulator [Pedosphaera parvula]EEF59548.1 response regulator receiver protein [Pedosphaera parvula Ellin514]